VRKGEKQPTHPPRKKKQKPVGKKKQRRSAKKLFHKALMAFFNAAEKDCEDATSEALMQSCDREKEINWAGANSSAVK